MANDPWAAFPDAPAQTNATAKGDAWGQFPDAGGQAQQPSSSGTYKWSDGSIADFPEPNAPTKQAAPVDPNAPKAYGSILPISQSQSGQWGFDPRGGFTGQLGASIANAASMPYDVTHGRMTLDSPDAAGRVLNAATLTTPGDFMPASSTIVKPSIASAAELNGAGDDARAVANSLGVLYDARPLPDQLRGTIRQSPTIAGQTHGILNEIQTQADSGPMSLQALDEHRQNLGDLAYKPGPATSSERSAAKQAISGIDQFVSNPPAQAVLAGDAPTASYLYDYARGNEAAVFRDDKVQARGRYAQFKADSTGNGANFDNLLRQRITPLLEPGKGRLSGFLPEEQQAVAGIPKGSLLQNSLRTASTAMGGGLGPLGAMEGIELGRAGWAGGEASGFGGPIGAMVGAGIPIAGRALRGVQNKIAQNRLDKVSEMLRSRSPLQQQRVQNAPSLELSPNAPGIAAVRAANVAAQPQLEQQQQPQYAKGGAVKSKHDRLVSRLMSLADKAKAAEKSKTKNILKLPDNTVTTALAKANAAI